MNTPSQFYQEQLEIYEEEVKALKKKLVASGMIRLAVFLAICFGLYFFFGNTRAVFSVLVVGVILFLFLISRHTNIKQERNLKQQLVALNNIELSVINGNYDVLPKGDEYKNPSHEYSQDIDLFGERSIYQFINRTALQSGANVLAHSLTNNDISNIPAKQEAIKELAALPTWRQLFSAKAALIKTQASADDTISWLQQYKSFTPSFTKVFCYGFSLLSLLLFIAYFLSIVSGDLLLVWFFVGLGISGFYLKRVSAVAVQTSKVQYTFLQFHKLLAQIEGQEFEASLLSENKEKVVQSAKSASKVLQQFSRHLSALDQRNNIMISLFTNAFMLRDVLQVHFIENWIKEHAQDVEQWFHAIAFFDGYNSLGNYAFNHPAHTFPKITHDNTVLSAKEAGHPLLNPEVNVLNDITIEKEQFFIITGANMAGKSTFLRTVALQIVMANAGLPVCAKEASYTPVKLITSMRTTDSLANDESYFFSELKRLKFIVDTMKSDQYFIILDEILKGTNSTDKAIGSRKFINKLVGSHSTGIIATHDLSLCEASDELPKVENYYFDAQIINDELHFDYTFKKGVCQNMNASFLLKKMDIVD